MRRQNNSLKNFISLIIFVLIIAGAVFIYFSPQFEKSNPKISFENSGFWNLKDGLKISLFDKSGIKSYKVYYKTANGEKILANKNIDVKQTNVMFEIEKLQLNQM